MYNPLNNDRFIEFITQSMADIHTKTIFAEAILPHHSLQLSDALILDPPLFACSLASALFIRRFCFRVNSVVLRPRPPFACLRSPTIPILIHSSRLLPPFPFSTHTHMHNTYALTDYNLAPKAVRCERGRTSAAAATAAA